MEILILSNQSAIKTFDLWYVTRLSFQQPILRSLVVQDKSLKIVSSSWNGQARCLRFILKSAKLDSSSLNHEEQQISVQIEEKHCNSSSQPIYQLDVSIGPWSVWQFGTFVTMMSQVQNLARRHPKARLTVRQILNGITHPLQSKKRGLFYLESVASFTICSSTSLSHSSVDSITLFDLPHRPVREPLRRI